MLSICSTSQLAGDRTGETGNGRRLGRQSKQVLSRNATVYQSRLGSSGGAGIGDFQHLQEATMAYIGLHASCERTPEISEFWRVG
jgi:hypothetical protein